MSDVVYVSFKKSYPALRFYDLQKDQLIAEAFLDFTCDVQEGGWSYEMMESYVQRMKDLMERQNV